MLLWILLVVSVPVFAVLNGRKALHTVSVAVSAGMLLVAGFETKAVMLNGKVEYSALGGIYYIDSLSIIIIDIVLVIGLMAAVFSIGYLEEELRHGKIDEGKVKRYYILMYTFMFTMVFALSVKNMGIMWIAIEATTLASAFLVGFYNDKRAIEATWKYVIICSVGIAIAMLGIIFLHLSSVGLFEGPQLLDWTVLYNSAEALKSPVLRLAFIFILIGFGTKAGLAPMHTWLPDAHSQAPSPISALLSGVLLNSAMYAIIRTVSIVNRNLGNNLFTGRVLIAAGMLSIATAAIFILTQKDYKRLLAYSSIEHMGIIAFAMGIFTPAAVFGALFHMINHSLTKSMLFLSSGSILQKYDTREISKIRGLLKILPISGTAFFIGLFAITGTPPFSVFASEFNIITAIFDHGDFLLGSIFVLLLAIVFAGIALTLFKIFWGDASQLSGRQLSKGDASQLSHGVNDSNDDYEGDASQKSILKGETNIPGAAVIVILLVMVLIMGIYMPSALKDLLTNAQQIIIGG